MFHRNLIVVSLALSASVPVSAQIDWRDPRAVVSAAIASDPALSRMRAEAVAAREGIEVAGARPAPMAMAGVSNLEADLASDPMMTMYMIGASQRILRPSRRAVREEIAESLVLALDAGVEARAAEIERDVLMSWFDVARVDEEARIVTRLSEILRAIVDTSRVRYETGSSSQSDIIRAQLAVSSTSSDLIRLAGEREAAVSRLLTLTGSSASEVPPLELEGDAGVERNAAVGNDHPALLAARARLEAQDARVRLAELADRPDVELEASYGYRPSAEGMISVTAKFELPLRSGTAIDPAIREAVALREAERHRIEEIERELKGELQRLAALQREVIAQIGLYGDVLVPQARLAVESALTSFQTGLTDLDSVLASQREVVRLERELVSLVARKKQLDAEEDAVREGALPRNSALSNMPRQVAQTSGMNGM